MMTSKKGHRGGYRVGAGRKKTAAEELRTSLTIRVSPKTRERLDQMRGEMSYGKLIDQLCEASPKGANQFHRETSAGGGDELWIEGS